MVTGLVGIVIGPDAAFRWSLYLLLSLWPVSVYLCARLFGAGAARAAAAAAMSPFLLSRIGIGYEQNAYVWVGFGVWTQLWASFTLPLAWGFSWRASVDGRLASRPSRSSRSQSRCISRPVTSRWSRCCCGRSSRAGRSSERRQGRLVLGGFAARRGVGDRAADRAAGVGRDQRDPARDRARQRLRRRPRARVARHRPTARPRPDPGRDRCSPRSASCSRRALQADANARALWSRSGHACCSRSAGPPSGRPSLIPGSGDIFFRRFMMGVQLAALLLAGRGAAWCAGGSGRVERPCIPRPHRPAGNSRARALAATAVVLAPAWLQLGRSTATTRRDRSPTQRRHDRGRRARSLIAMIQADGGGRVYAGMPTNWGADFTVGRSRSSSTSRAGMSTRSGTRCGPRR